MNVGVREAKTHLSELLRRVQNGETITIERYGKPVARLIAIPESAAQRRSLGPWKQAWGVPEEAFSSEVDAAVADLFNQ